MTEPLTPADCDLRSFPYMPLDVARLRDSDLANTQTPEACWAAVQLWCASWHQVPAASLPDDDRVLAKLAGYGRVMPAWMAIRNGALHGFVKCTDGRLYHPVVAEKACDCWSKRRIQSEKGKAGANKRWADRAQSDSTGHAANVAQASTADSTGIACAIVLDSNREGEVTTPTPSAGADLLGAEIGHQEKRCPPCPHDAVIALYHEVLPSNPEVRRWNDKRVAALRRFWRDQFQETKFATQAEGLARLRKYFEYVGRSAFLTGKVAASSSDRAPFLADLEWLVKDDHYTKIIEGYYHRAAPKRSLQVSM